MALIDEFFVDVDRAWRWPARERTPLRIIGSGALMLQTTYHRATKDGDVWDALGLSDEVAQRLTLVAGRESIVHTRRRMYIDIVPNGVPLIPHPVRFIEITALNAKLAHFRIEALNVVDVVVSKLKRFNADDRSDVDAMIRRGTLWSDFSLCLSLLGWGRPGTRRIDGPRGWRVGIIISAAARSSGPSPP